MIHAGIVACRKDKDRDPCGKGWEYDFYLRNVLHNRLPDAKIVINNDAKCAVQAEASVGALKDVKDGVVLIFGTMIGGGIVLDHRVRQGIHFAAGEVSYIISDRKDPSCETVWGNRCGTPFLCRSYAQRKKMDPSAVDGVRVFEYVHVGDEDAVAVLTEFTKNVAVQIFNLQTVLDSERFAIGGGISAQPVFIDYIKRHLEQMYAMSPYFVPHAEVVAVNSEMMQTLWEHFSVISMKNMSSPLISTK